MWTRLIHILWAASQVEGEEQKLRGVDKDKSPCVSILLPYHRDLAIFVRKVVLDYLRHPECPKEKKHHHVIGQQLIGEQDSH